MTPIGTEEWKGWNWLDTAFNLQYTNTLFSQYRVEALKNEFQNLNSMLLNRQDSK